jgi:hypothetical protein
MGNTAKKINNSKKADLKVIKTKRPTAEKESYSLEELVKMYPGLSLDSAAMLAQAHNFFKKSAA